MLKGSPQRQQLQHLLNRSSMFVFVPLFLIMSSSVYPAVISGIENKELAVVADALAKMDYSNNEVIDTSGYHSSILSSTAPDRKSVV